MSIYTLLRCMYASASLGIFLTRWASRRYLLTVAYVGSLATFLLELRYG